MTRPAKLLSRKVEAIRILSSNESEVPVSFPLSEIQPVTHLWALPSSKVGHVLQLHLFDCELAFESLIKFPFGVLSLAFYRNPRAEGLEGGFSG